MAVRFPGLDDIYMVKTCISVWIMLLFVWELF